MANPGTQSNDDELCQELNKRTSPFVDAYLSSYLEYADAGDLEVN